MLVWLLSSFLDAITASKQAVRVLEKRTFVFFVVSSVVARFAPIAKPELDSLVRRKLANIPCGQTSLHSFTLPHIAALFQAVLLIALLFYASSYFEQHVSKCNRCYHTFPRGKFALLFAM